MKRSNKKSRYFFYVSYLGTSYHGWQVQKNAISIQSIITEKLKLLQKSEVEIVGSGRTDTGVHATGQVFHADLIIKDTHRLKSRLNRFLPPEIAVYDVKKVNPDSHARFDATSRTYQYHIHLEKDPFLEGKSLYFPFPLDLDKMNKAASYLTGEHDFQSFSKVKTDVNHFFCNISKSTWRQTNNGLIFTITANRFLRGMVRALVGTLLDVGKGKISLSEFKKIMNVKDRRKAGWSVPPEGLFLIQVRYPPKIFLS